jgi:hypothetical protein
MKTLPIFIAFVFGASATAARADLRWEAETGTFYDSNLSNSDRQSDEQPDLAWLTTARVIDSWQLTRDLRFDVDADLLASVWRQYYEFDQISPGFSAGLRYRFGLGRSAPWLLLENHLGYAWFRETARDGCRETLALRGGLALSERIAMEAGYAFENFAASGNFFDTQAHRVDVRLMVDVTSALRLSLGYVYREGDVIAYARPPRPDIVAVASAEMEDVDAFGALPPRNAYKLLGRTNGAAVSAAYAVTKNVSIEVSYEFDVTSHDPLQYQNHYVQARVALAY